MSSTVIYTLSLHDALPIYDLGVVPGVGRRGYGLDELVQIGRAANPVDFGAFGQFVRHRDGVRRFPASVEVDDGLDRKSTRLNSSHVEISYAVFCLKKKKKQ